MAQLVPGKGSLSILTACVCNISVLDKCQQQFPLYLFDGKPPALDLSLLRSCRRNITTRDHHCITLVDLTHSMSARTADRLRANEIDSKSNYIRRMKHKRPSNFMVNKSKNT